MTPKHVPGGRALAAVASLVQLFALMLVLTPALARPAAAAETDECATPAELTEASLSLPHLAERLHRQQPVAIVAIGGASTIGQAAGSPDLAYPHRLEQNLQRDFPGVPISVVNKGVPRQSAMQNVQRFPTDVFAEDPVLVIWETGINDAVRGTPVDDFAATLQSGVDQLKNRAIDTILVDMQFSHSSSTVLDFDRYLRALHRIGDVNDLYVFPRFEMMRYWSEQNVFNFDDVAPPDRARLAARVYECLGRKLAQVIRSAVR